MKSTSSTRWYTLQIVLAILVWFGILTANGDSNSILRESNCAFMDTRVNESGTLSVANNTKPCEWTTESLKDLGREAIIYNTKDMHCDGRSVEFTIDSRKRTKNFCNQPNCVVFVRQNGRCNNNETVNKIVRNLFEECKEFEWYIKRHPFKIITSNDTNFELNYTLFDCRKETGNEGQAAIATVPNNLIESEHSRTANTTNTQIQTTSGTIEDWTVYTTASPGILKENNTDETITNKIQTTAITGYTTASPGIPKVNNTDEPFTDKIQTTAIAGYTTASTGIVKENNTNETFTEMATHTSTSAVDATVSTVGDQLSTGSPTKMPNNTGEQRPKDHSEDRADKIAILFNTNCKEYQESKVGVSATLTVANKTRHCYWKMRQLDHLQRKAIIYNTKGMHCEGGPVEFHINYEDKSQRKNFCNHTKCLVYVREDSSCHNQESLNEIIQNSFDDCKEFEWYIKPTPLEIRAPIKTTGFRLNYTLFNCPKETKNQVMTTAPSMEEPHTPTESPTEMPITRESPTEMPITRGPKETRGVIAANTGNGSSSRVAAWWIILPLVLIALIAIALAIGYLIYRRKKTASKRMNGRRKVGKDEHISTIAL